DALVTARWTRYWRQDRRGYRWRGGRRRPDPHRAAPPPPDRKFLPARYALHRRYWRIRWVRQSSRCDWRARRRSPAPRLVRGPDRYSRTPGPAVHGRPAAPDGSADPAPAPWVAPWPVPPVPPPRYRTASCARTG